jgi:hypothetical protein
MRERDQGEGGARMGAGARGTDWAGPARLGHTAGQNPRHTRPPIGI